jgi:hypothetical protein
VNGEGISYSDNGTGFAYLYYYPYSTFTGSTLNIADRLRVVAQFSGTLSSAAASTNPDYFALGMSAQNNTFVLTCAGPNSSYGNKFVHYNQFTVNSYASNTTAITQTGVTTSVTGAIRLEFDGQQGNFYTGADRKTSPPGLTEFPAPGDITPQGRVRMLTNTGQPKLINNYVAPFTSSQYTSIFLGFDANATGDFSGSLQRLTIFRYGAN